ncbi:hypothetical protein RRG08_001108 [Elysia crispata]|uniref:Uncharacterized protein n=1 Tax=Elysia crispata TaxID=231223 RepID=A0AAE1AW42_9GAST|nr:hypothetical protein RRG08_001108 [Elysia crispata]
MRRPMTFGQGVVRVFSNQCTGLSITGTKRTAGSTPLHQAGKKGWRRLVAIAMAFITESREMSGEGTSIIDVITG